MGYNFPYGGVQECVPSELLAPCAAYFVVRFSEVTEAFECGYPSLRAFSMSNNYHSDRIRETVNVGSDLTILFVTFSASKNGLVESTSLQLFRFIFFVADSAKGF